MPERIHSAPCALRTADAEARRKVYRHRWPNACATCAARGGAHLRDLVTGLDSFEGCHECFEVGLCPRCNSALHPSSTAGHVCPRCGWSGPDDGEPPFPGCVCPPSSEVARG